MEIHTIEASSDAGVQACDCKLVNAIGRGIRSHLRKCNIYYYYFFAGVEFGRKSLNTRLGYGIQQQ